MTTKKEVLKMEYAISVLQRELNNCLEGLEYYELEGYNTSLLLDEKDQLEYILKVLQGQANV